MRAFLLALAAAAVLIVLIPSAAAETRLGAVTTFSDANSFELVVEWVFTGPDASSHRSMFGINGDPSVVDAAELDSYCRWAKSNIPVDLRVDGYGPFRVTVPGTCAFEGMLGTSVRSEAEARMRTTHPIDGVLSEVSVITVLANSANPARVDVSIGAPEGRSPEPATPWSGWRSVGTRGVGSLAPAERGTTRFVPTGGSWPYDDWEERAMEVHLFRGHVVVASTRSLTGTLAEAYRQQADADRNGAVSTQEADAARARCESEFSPYPPEIAGSALPLARRACTLEGVVGAVGYAGRVEVHAFDDHATALPEAAFTLLVESEPASFLVHAPEGRPVTSLNGVSAAAYPRGGADATGRVLGSGTWVQVAVSAAPAPPPPPAPTPPAEEAGATTSPPAGEPEPAPEMAPGASARETRVTLYDDAGGLLMRWSITDLRTDATARAFRSGLDSDSDNQVSADELASYDASVRLVPPPDAWPFTLAGRAPVSTRVLSVEITGLEGAYNAPEPVRILTTYEATYDVARGELAGNVLDYGDSLAIAAPYGVPLHGEAARNLDDVRMGDDGSWLVARPTFTPWSVLVGERAAEAPAPAAAEPPPAAAPDAAAEAPSAPAEAAAGGGTGPAPDPASGPGPDDAPAFEASGGATPATPEPAPSEGEPLAEGGLSGSTPAGSVPEEAKPSDAPALAEGAAPGATVADRGADGPIDATASAGPDTGATARPRAWPWILLALVVAGGAGLVAWRRARGGGRT